jgi:hypothetical protein
MSFLYLSAGLCNHRTIVVLSVSNQVISTGKPTTQPPRVVLEMSTNVYGAATQVRMRYLFLNGLFLLVLIVTLGRGQIPAVSKPE